MPNESIRSVAPADKRPKTDRRRPAPDRGLLAIGLFKLAKSALFFFVGIGAIHMLHKDLGEEVLGLTARLRFDPEGRLVTMLMNRAGLVDAHRLKQISTAALGYSALALVEGTGLLLEKSWAEYVTLALTASFLPVELYELTKKPDWLRVALLLINMAVLAYLVWLLRRKSIQRDT